MTRTCTWIGVMLATAVTVLAQDGSEAGRRAAIAEAQQRIASDYARSDRSPFTAIASRYFGNGDRARLVLDARGAAFVGAEETGGVAVFHFDGRVMSITPVPGAAPLVVHAGAGGTGRPLADKATLGDQDLLRAGAMVIETGARPGTGRVVVYDPDAPARKAFKGLNWFPPNLALQARATFTPIANPDQVIVGTSRGLQKEYFRVGHFSFDVDGAPARLVALATSATPKEGDELFIPFRDATTGHESYAVGRYLNVPFNGTKAEYVLDFNVAFNPYCAYSTHFNCVIPPRENTLKVAIRAGEMAYAKHE